GHFLDRPPVAVGIAEVDEPSPRHVLDLTHRNPALGELRVRLLDIRHHHLQALDRSGPHLRQSGADGNRTPRARRRQLHEAQILIDLLVVIGVEADLVDVESLGAVDGRYRHGDQLDLPVHTLTFLLKSSGGTLSILFDTSRPAPTVAPPDRIFARSLRGPQGWRSPRDECE